VRTSTTIAPLAMSFRAASESLRFGAAVGAGAGGFDSFAHPASASAIDTASLDIMCASLA
jgi:hypothetical protein